MITIINQKSTLVGGFFKTINAIQLTNFKNYDFSGNSGGVVEYALGYKDEDGFVPYQNTEITIPQSILDNWGSDDSVILNYIICERSY